MVKPLFWGLVIGLFACLTSCTQEAAPPTASALPFEGPAFIFFYTDN